VSTTARLQELLDQFHGGVDSARDALLEHSLERLRLLARRMLRRQSDLRALEETDDILSKAVIRLNHRLPERQGSRAGETNPSHHFVGRIPVRISRGERDIGPFVPAKAFAADERAVLLYSADALKATDLSGRGNEGVRANLP
jgi:hypothetical protein